jgi:protein gp37
MTDPKRTGTLIEYVDEVLNPWTGCTPVHTGCKNCYARANWTVRKRRIDFDNERRLPSAAYMRQPFKWNREAEAAGVRKRVGLEFMGDFFEDYHFLMSDASGPVRGCRMDEVRHEVRCIIDETLWLDWIVPTKRPENIRRFWQWARAESEAKVLRPNVWLLASVSDQETADRLVPELLKCRALVPVIGLSIEPLVGPIDLDIDWLIPPCPGCGRQETSPYCECDLHGEYAEPPTLDWLVIGGESGPKARPCDIDWIRQLVEQGESAGVATYVKQIGRNPYYCTPRDAATLSSEALDIFVQHKKGGDPDEWPEEFPREFPEVNHA